MRTLAYAYFGALLGACLVASLLEPEPVPHDDEACERYTQLANTKVPQLTSQVIELRVALADLERSIRAQAGPHSIRVAAR